MSINKDLESREISASRINEEDGGYANHTVESQLVPFDIHESQARLKDTEKGDALEEDPQKAGKERHSIARSSMLSSQSAEAESEAALRQRSGWQKLDDFLWFRSQEEFQLQCREVPHYMRGRERWLVYQRMFWIVVLTFELSVDRSDGGTSFEVADLSKWSLWLTYATFVLGLFACAPPVEKTKQEYQRTRSSPCQSWKMFTVLFELSFLVSIVITLVYWTMIHEGKYMREFTWKRKVDLIMNHSVPLVAMLTDYSMNCQPFLKRHFLIAVLFLGAYLSVLMTYSINGNNPYSNIDWDSFKGTLIPIMMVFASFALFFLLEAVNRCKLRKIGGV